MKKVILFALALFFFLFSDIFAGVATDTVMSKEKRENIKTFMHLIKADDMGNVMFESIVAPFKQQIKTAPSDYWDKLRNSFMSDSLARELEQIYNKAFSNDELKEMISFFNSASGQKFIATIPQVTNECYSISEQWAFDVRGKVRDRLIMDGYLNTQR